MNIILKVVALFAFIFCVAALTAKPKDTPVAVKLARAPVVWEEDPPAPVELPLKQDTTEKPVILKPVEAHQRLPDIGDIDKVPGN